MKKSLYIILLFITYSIYGQDILQKGNDYLYLIWDTVSYDKCGYIDSKGDTIVPFDKYSICYTDTIKKLGIVYFNGKGFLGIDNKDSILFEIFSFDNGPDEPSDELFRIIQDGKIGYADLNGEIIIKPQFNCAEPFYRGYAKVSMVCIDSLDGENNIWNSSSWYFIDHFGNKVSGIKVYDCPAFYDKDLKRVIYTYSNNIPLQTIAQKFLSEIISNIKIEDIPKPIDAKGIVAFVIDTNGIVFKIEILNSISKNIDNQIVEMMKRWDNFPTGYCKGNPVPVEIVLPYHVDYQNDEEK
jgi:hypothetical protein